MLDLLIKNGQYPDFSEGRMKQGNIGITDGKITYIGPEEPDTKERLDARRAKWFPLDLSTSICTRNTLRRKASITSSPK